MPDQQPDKRCGTCEHYTPTRCNLVLPIWLMFTIVMDINRHANEDESCSFWTPKPPKNPEEK